MAGDKRTGILVPALAGVLVGAVVADVVRRVLVKAPRAAAAVPAAPTPPAAPAAPADSGAGAAPGEAEPISRTSAAARPPELAAFRGASVAATAPTAEDAARRIATRERIAQLGAATYLPEILAASDSMLRRWPDDRFGRALSVAVVRAPVDGFDESFVGNVVWAAGRWNGATLPVQMVIGGDTTGADITVRWVARMDSNRTGRADVTWDDQGRIRRVAVFLATHGPDGRALNGSQMVSLALHELGHSLGLAHSSTRSDALYPQTTASELTDRDRRTVNLLYSLPPGSIR